jgi:S-adenosylmethionine:tRNA ribosyltransferase-isomerase
LTVTAAGLDFALRDAPIAQGPPEARGLPRDGVRLMVSRVSDGSVRHARFSDLPDFLEPGDLLVANESATIHAALEAFRPPAATASSGEPVLLHLSTPLAGPRWVVELRRRTPSGHVPLLDASPGDRLALPAQASARLVSPYRAASSIGRTRLWVAEIDTNGDVLSYTARHGAPIRYGYVPQAWPLSAYQTVFSRVPGSAEMPSAARPFTHALIRRLQQHGVHVAAVVLHTGVSSLDADESPYAERYRVPPWTADTVNRTRASGGRVIAVGTTVVRALETVAREDGLVATGEGWTDVVITPDRGVRAVDGILTGLHGPSASHLSMLEALAGRERLAQAYAAALGRGYLWHEFGDSHLILP